MAIHAEDFAGRAEQRQKHDDEGVQQDKPVTPLRIGDAQDAQACAETKILGSPEPECNHPPFQAMAHDPTRTRLAVARSQAPRLLHRLRARDGADPTLARPDLGAAQIARPSAHPNPCGRGAGLAVGRRDMNVAAEPDHTGNAQRFETGVSALVGADAMLAVTTQGPISAVVLVMELTGFARAGILPLLLAVAAATLIARTIEPRSIYDARLTDAQVRSRQRARDRAMEESPN